MGTRPEGCGRVDFGSVAVESTSTRPFVRRACAAVGVLALLVSVFFFDGGIGGKLDT